MVADIIEEEGAHDLDVAVLSAVLVAWDGYHQIYLALDDIEAKKFADGGWTTYSGTPEEMYLKVKEWYLASSGLRYVSSARSGKDSGWEYRTRYCTLIPQGAGYDDHGWGEPEPAE